MISLFEPGRRLPMQVPALLPRAADCLECFTLHAGVPTSSQSLGEVRHKHTPGMVAGEGAVVLCLMGLCVCV